MRKDIKRKVNNMYTNIWRHQGVISKEWTEMITEAKLLMA